MEELDQEMGEYARDHSLHMDDDRDEIIHGYIEQLVDNADWKDHGEQDFDPADMEMGEELDRMRELAGIEHIAEEWDWDSGSYDEKAGYDVNFNLWSQEVQKERSQFGDKPFKDYNEMHQEFQSIMKQRGINVFRQKQLSMAKQRAERQAQIDRYTKKPEQAEMDF